MLEAFHTTHRNQLGFFPIIVSFVCQTAMVYLFPSPYTAPGSIFPRIFYSLSFSLTSSVESLAILWVRDHPFPGISSPLCHIVQEEQSSWSLVPLAICVRSAWLTALLSSVARRSWGCLPQERLRCREDRRRCREGAERRLWDSSVPNSCLCLSTSWSYFCEQWLVFKNHGYRTWGSEGTWIISFKLSIKECNIWW